MDTKNTGRFFLIVLLVLMIPGTVASFAASRNQTFERGENPSLPFLTLYTTGLATGPQLALWQAIERGRILEKCNIRVKLWNNLDELEQALVTGDGDLWLGHTDVFVEAARRGAPVQLFLTTGWRKFYLVSSDPENIHFDDFIGKSLAVSPPGSPAVPILQSLGNGQFTNISFFFEPPKTILHQLIQGEVSAALLPEPLVTKVLSANPGLMMGENVADLYAQYTGKRRGMPIAGIAVNSSTAEKYPEIITWIAQETIRYGKPLSKNPQSGVASLPDEFQQLMPKKLIEISLQREQLDVFYSHAVKREIKEYMKNLSLASKNEHKHFPVNLFWQHGLKKGSKK